MTPRPRAAEIRFYFDADVLGVAKVIGQLRSDATYPGDPGAVIHKRTRPSCPIADTATADHIWIPEVAERGWLIITRDSRIAVTVPDLRRERPRRKDGGAIGQRSPEHLAAARGRVPWRAIEHESARPGPFIWRATRSGLGRVMLD